MTRAPERCSCGYAARYRQRANEWAQSWLDARFTQPGREAEWTRHIVDDFLRRVGVMEPSVTMDAPTRGVATAEELYALLRARQWEPTVVAEIGIPSDAVCQRECFDAARDIATLLAERWLAREQALGVPGEVGTIDSWVSRAMYDDAIAKLTAVRREFAEYRDQVIASEREFRVAAEALCDAAHSHFVVRACRNRVFIAFARVRALLGGDK